ncbi:ROK family glucokinase [Rossellomorea marisflavi]|uniref:Glucokinase n=2 Tax=Rossellomorea marisflavi TaxID=189381 RepID=A0A165K8Y2_9BACI|nr:ROK family glucokinase [Rossellomorea marisflavi]KML04129.1 glucokinase [Rossellomorea marisflavi]KZE48532.1 glucokinase [Rossellomorea marisflavi]MCM2591455.1 ROK family glucokinase [Rossellomorea marisflavi]MCM2606793.1 ROK family glucokinase [Rossellomorea marisflavi]QHA34670.1 ROK family glucokinase [Rossellomorea marisflavi]
MKKLLGIDLGGTTVKFAIMTEDGEIQQKWSIGTDIRNDGKQIVPQIIESINHHLELYGLSADTFLGIGMGSPGTVDRENGTVIGAYNLNWSTLIPVRQMIEAGTGIPLYIDNDANVAALGEGWKGAGENGKDVVFVTLGTGVGGGIIAEENLLHGNVGAAGEIGHMIVEPEGYLCTCGNHGCLETVASATGVVRLARDLSEEYAGDSELKGLIDDGQELTAKTIFDQAKAGDPLAVIVADKFFFYLGLACANIGNLLNPETIVIGGGVSAAGDMLLEGVEKYFQQFAFPSIRTSTKLKLAQLGNDAGVIGAGSLVTRQK